MDLTKFKNIVKEDDVDGLAKLFKMEDEKFEEIFFNIIKTYQFDKKIFQYLIEEKKDEIIKNGLFEKVLKEILYYIDDSTTPYSVFYKNTELLLKNKYPVKLGYESIATKNNLYLYELLHQYGFNFQPPENTYSTILENKSKKVQKILLENLDFQKISLNVKKKSNNLSLVQNAFLERDFEWMLQLIKNGASERINFPSKMNVDFSKGYIKYKMIANKNIIESLNMLCDVNKYQKFYNINSVNLSAIGRIEKAMQSLTDIVEQRELVKISRSLPKVHNKVIKL